MATSSGNCSINTVGNKPATYATLKGTYTGNAQPGYTSALPFKTESTDKKLLLVTAAYGASAIPYDMQYGSDHISPTGYFLLDTAYMKAGKYCGQNKF